MDFKVYWRVIYLHESGIEDSFKSHGLPVQVKAPVSWKAFSVDS